MSNTEPDEFDRQVAGLLPCDYEIDCVTKGWTPCDKCIWRQRHTPAVAAALRELARLKSHLPDCCLNETCNEDENILHADVAAQVMNSLPKGVVISTDDYITVADKIGDLAHAAVKAAIKEREAQIAAKDAENRDLLQAVDGMIADREYFERIATQPCSQCVQRGIGAEECRQYSRVSKLEDNS
jgi:hypothetical protein